ncbi:aldehyde dehydrogenase [Cucurbitaria berberidis CBS 394.84]|uniref:Aldehyde dehydrogenase n=1 Tax=Cucurbitaria berberidis CBS 394.84 TaxID=1168544 RepID=A0A9P4LCR3_9PLEO|nr:aldehyde dehydrogenase [Cucurbitaria berberidis CBS 394.84]KAF1849953.1 aldehyde dehydrogenase [Cucurbitaria berberidis CBS 394.84]
MGSAGKYELPFKLNNPDLLRNLSYVNGEWVKSKSGKTFEVVDPGTGKAWIECPINDASDVDEAVKSSYESFLEYKKTSPRQRAQMLYKWDSLIKENREDIATLLVYETGKPKSEAYGEIDYSTGFTWWFAGEAERIQGSVFTPALPNRRVFTIKQPLGVAVALVPWNFPIAMNLRKAGAALAAGCTMIIKPSPETPITILTLAYLAEKAGFPKGALTVLTTDLDKTPELSEALCRHPLVSKVTFTGSTRVGKLIARICADNLKKVTLELGGNCPVLIFDDANIEQALSQIFALKYRHAGQACITANRIYVQSGIFDKFLDRWNAETQKIVVGHGSDEETTMGPVTTPRSIQKALELVEDAKKKGAKIHIGGNKIEKNGGYFFEPTVITGVTQDMDIAREEIFSPISTFIKFETEDEAVKAANDTSMGLASYLFTKNVDRLWRLFESLEAGMIGLNTGNSSAAESPFGGIKQSGYGKESGKDVAVNEYLITKTGTFTLEEQS